jgi:hypothetical protein
VRLLRLYPAAWRARYGQELATLIDELEGGARMSWRVRLDVLRAAARERARMLGLRGLPPGERAREGSLLVLRAWMLFVIGGFGVQKASEQWQGFTPASKQALPAAAFDVLAVTAVIGSLLVAAGVAASLPRLLALVRGGGWPQIARPILRAVSLSALGAGLTVALAVWAHSLTPGARNGHDGLYGAAFLAWVVLGAACLFAWAAAASATARRLTISAPLLRFEVWVGAALSAAMVVMTIASAVWWGSLARAAPWFFEGGPVGSNASALAPNIVIPVALMLIASVVGLGGAIRALRALAQASARPALRSR